MKQRRWNRESVIAEIRRLYRRQSPLNSSSISVRARPLYAAGMHWFGTWEKAITASGIDYAMVRKSTPWNRKLIVEAIQRLRRSGTPLNSGYAMQNFSGMHGAGKHLFGTWEKAITASGIDYATVRIGAPAQRWNRDRVIACIRRRKRRALPLNAGAVQESDSGLYNAARRCFPRPRWSNALGAAGFEPEVIQRKVWSPKRIILAIKELRKRYAVLNGWYLGQRGHRSLVAAGKRNFGSWALAVEAAGISFPSVAGGRKCGWWTNERVLEEILKLHDQGILLSYATVNALRRDLVVQGRKRFGSLKAAVRSAGLQYHDRAGGWSTASWLRSLTREEFVSISNRAAQLARNRHRRRTRK